MNDIFYTPPAPRDRPSHAYLAAKEARHQRRLEFERSQAPLNEPVNQADLETNSTQTTPLQRNSCSCSTSSASSETVTTATDTASAITAPVSTATATT